MTLNGPHALGGFKGNARKGKAKWNQKGATRPSKQAGKSSSSVTGPIATVVYTIAAFVVTMVVSMVAFLTHGYGLWSWPW